MRITWKKGEGVQIACYIAYVLNECHYKTRNGKIIPYMMRTLHGKGRHQNYLPPTKNFSQKLTHPSSKIGYPVGDLCRCFTKQTLPSAYTLHLIPPTDGINGLL